MSPMNVLPPSPALRPRVHYIPRLTEDIRSYVPWLTEEYIGFFYISPLFVASPYGESPKQVPRDIQAHTRTIYRMTVEVST
jgi:hypothetical protein